MSSPFPKPEKYNYKYFRFLIWLSYRGRGNNHQTTKKRCILTLTFFRQFLDPLGTVWDKHNPQKPDLLEKSNHLFRTHVNVMMQLTFGISVGCCPRSRHCNGNWGSVRHHLHTSYSICLKKV